jgi:hypothetical protein
MSVSTMPVAAGVLAERIRRRAATITPGAVAMALVATPFLMTGWVARKTLGAVWLVVAHLGAAVVVGWQAGARRPDGGG